MNDGRRSVDRSFGSSSIDRFAHMQGRKPRFAVESTANLKHCDMSRCFRLDVDLRFTVDLP